MTSRYITSSLGLQKLRDDQWWESTLRALGDDTSLSHPQAFPIRDDVEKTSGSHAADADPMDLHADPMDPDVVDLTMDRAPACCIGKADDGGGGSRSGANRRDPGAGLTTMVTAAATAASGTVHDDSRKGIQTVGRGSKASRGDLPVGGSGGKSILSAAVAADADASRLRAQREDHELRQRATSLMQVRTGPRFRSGSRYGSRHRASVSCFRTSPRALRASRPTRYIRSSGTSPSTRCDQISVQRGVQWCSMYPGVKYILQMWNVKGMHWHQTTNDQLVSKGPSPGLFPIMCVHQALRPGSALLGTHKGEPYYLRSAVSELHTAFRWRREGREVLPGALRRRGSATLAWGNNLTSRHQLVSLVIVIVT